VLIDANFTKAAASLQTTPVLLSHPFPIAQGFMAQLTKFQSTAALGDDL
jgi:hypothetical protein